MRVKAVIGEMLTSLTLWSSYSRDISGGPH